MWAVSTTDHLNHISFKKRLVAPTSSAFMVLLCFTSPNEGIDPTMFCKHENVDPLLPFFPFRKTWVFPLRTAERSKELLHGKLEGVLPMLEEELKLLGVLGLRALKTFLQMRFSKADSFLE